MDFKDRFRGFLPVVVDLETGGFDPERNPLLELGCSMLDWDGGRLAVQSTHTWTVAPFSGCEVDPSSLKVTGIQLTEARGGVDEKVAMAEFFRMMRRAMKQHHCHRAILVAHNVGFDAGFIRKVCERTGIRRSPFHPFSSIDSATLAAVAYGHTVLSEACKRAGLSFENARAHSAAYDAERTAALFCEIVNGWPLDTTRW